MKNGRTTIYDVAKAAGVSAAAVSSVLTGRKLVSAETAARIRAVITELGYQPRPYKNRALKRKESASKAGGQILFLVGDTNPESSRTYQMQKVVLGASMLFAEFGLDMLVSNLSANGGVPLCLKKNQVKGVILRSGEKLPAGLTKALSGFPCVEFFRPGMSSKWDGVVVDDEKGVHLAVNHLLARGCTELIGISPDRKNRSLHFRLRMFRFAAEEAGVKVTIHEVEEGQSIERILPARPRGQKHLGIFICGYNEVNRPDDIAVRLKEKGLVTEHQVHVVDFATIPSVSHPSLVVSLERIGRHCAEQVVWRLGHPDADQRRIMIAPTLCMPHEDGLENPSPSREGV